MMTGNIEKDILDYFNNNFTTRKENGMIITSLHVLDNKYKSYYSGVSLNYICYDLLKAKYKKSEVAKILLKLLIERQIRALYCPNVKKYVFENKKGNYSSSFVSDNLKDYLNSFIKNE